MKAKTKAPWLIGALTAACSTQGPVLPTGEAAAARLARCGVDAGAMDEAADPWADFHRFATGGWPDEGPMTDVLAEDARGALAAEGARSDAFVAAYEARDPRDAEGTRPVLEGARDLLEVRDRRALSEAAGLAALRGGTTPFRVD